MTGNLKSGEQELEAGDLLMPRADRLGTVFEEGRPVVFVRFSEDGRMVRVSAPRCGPHNWFSADRFTFHSRPAPAALQGSSSSSEGEGVLAAAVRELQQMQGIDRVEREAINTVLRALHPSSAADAKPVAWPTEEVVARKLATIKGHRDLEHEIVCDDQVARPVWKIYLRDAREVMSLYAQPHTSQQAGAEGVEDALRRLTVLRDQARNGTPVTDPNEWEADELDAILAALKPVSA